MKLSRTYRNAIVASLALAASLSFTACNITRTIDYVYLACAAPLSNGDGQIQIFATDQLSGALRPTVTAVDSGGPLPVSVIASSNYNDLYVANQGNNTIVHFAINDDSSLTQKDVVTLSSEGNTPVAIAVNQADTYLYVITAYQPGCNTPLTCSGALSIFPLSSGTIGTPVANGNINYWPLSLSGAHASDIIVPTGINVLKNGSGVLVSAYDQSSYDPGGNPTSNANGGWVFSFNVGSGGTLTAAPNSPYQAGVKPSGIASDPSNRFVYVTDFASNEMVAYSIQSNNALLFLQNGPFKTGYEPTSIVIDPRGLYIYVTNSLDNTVSAYSISLPTGTPSTAVNPSGSTTNATDTDPVAISVEPSLGRDVYTANHIGNSVSGFTINPSTGTIKPNQATPYPALGNPTSIASIPHGNYSQQYITN